MYRACGRGTEFALPAGIGSVRGHARLKQGGEIKEKLDETEDTGYSYEILESPLPVKNYHAKLWVEPDDRDPTSTTIHWDATFDANGASDDDAKKVIGDIFTAGLKGLKQKAMPPEGQE